MQIRLFFLRRLIPRSATCEKSLPKTMFEDPSKDASLYNVCFHFFYGSLIVQRRGVLARLLYIMRPLLSPVRISFQPKKHGLLKLKKVSLERRALVINAPFWKQASTTHLQTN